VHEFDKNTFIFYNILIFNNTLMLNENYIEIYKKLYNLPEFIYREKVNFDFFRLCEKNYMFAIVCVYNERGELLLLRDFDKSIGWELPGGSVKEKEKIEDAANRIILDKTGFYTDELQPIALVENIFEYENKIIKHFGVAFIAAVRGKIKPQPDNIKISFAEETNEKIAYQNKKIFDEAKKIIRKNISQVPYGEIDYVKAFFPCYLFNKYVVKIFNRQASKKIRREVIKLISKKPQKIIDVSCGDDRLILELEKIYKPDICIGNDISWKTISLIKGKNKKSNVIFTNHNTLNLPFKKIFDLLIFKNTLHHIPESEQEEFIKNLVNLSKQTIVVDIEDPAQSNFLTKLWHWYYVHILKDQGENFLTFDKFQKIIKDNVKDGEINFGIISTLKGKYFYASVLKKIKSEEVEIKVSATEAEIKTALNKLNELKADFKSEEEEEDIYFTTPHRDFIKTRECLRIREKNNFLELTYKGPTTKPMEDKKQFWKSEINIPLKSNKEEMRMLLENIGFTEVAKVTKKRQKFLIGNQEISFDKIENLGWFVEIENTAENKEERQKALEENIKLLKELGLNEKDVVDEPYRDLVIKNRK